ncbi:granzyme K-like [Mustelus asterias]
MSKMLQVAFIVSIINTLASQGCYCVEIIGGHDVKPGSGSYMASIQTAKMHICGGTLIHARWVLTSANCANDDFLGKYFRVVLGIRSLKENKTAQEFEVIKAIPHPHFDKKTERDNLALLKLHRAAKLNKFVKVLKLPKSTKAIKYGAKCKSLGWGHTTDDDDADPSDILQEISLTVIKQETCNSKSYYNHDPVITDDMICAGDKKGRAKMCRGDAGGPLICLKTKMLTGIDAFGKGCDTVDKPGIYTRLSDHYLKWIKTIMKGKLDNFTVEQN